MRRALLALLCLLATGCTPVLYVLLRMRAGGTRPLALGQSVTGDTSSSGDDRHPSCGNTEDGGDDTWTFVAPETGEYAVDVHGQYDCVVAVFRHDSELRCNDDTGSTTHSQVVVTMERGREYEVVVDGYHGASGRYTLTVTRHVPPPAVAADPAPTTPPPEESVAAMEPRCAAAPALAMGTTTGAVDPGVATAVLTCGNRGAGGDVVYRVTVDAPGTLAVREESNWDAVLELRRGCSEGRTVVACVDDVGDTRHSAITTRLAPGTYYLVVDSYAPNARGSFTLESSFTPDPQVATDPADAGPR